MPEKVYRLLTAKAKIHFVSHANYNTAARKLSGPFKIFVEIFMGLWYTRE